MRIITGSARGTKLMTLEGDATRPTSERAKEAVFSVLQFSIEGRRVLDLFAGSGQLGLEALSRGAESAVFIDNSREAAGIIRANAAKTHLSDKCRIETADVAEKLGRMGSEQFDIVFIDPPYASGRVPETLSLLLRHGRLKPTSYVVAETRDGDVFGADERLASAFTVYRSNAYGIVHMTILQPSEEAGE